jgi:hypothetical protein
LSNDERPVRCSDQQRHDAGSQGSPRVTARRPVIRGAFAVSTRRRAVPDRWTRHLKTPAAREMTARRRSGTK